MCQKSGQTPFCHPPQQLWIHSRCPLLVHTCWQTVSHSTSWSGSSEVHTYNVCYSVLYISLNGCNYRVSLISHGRLNQIIFICGIPSVSISAVSRCLNELCTKANRPQTLYIGVESMELYLANTRIPKTQYTNSWYVLWPIPAVHGCADSHQWQKCWTVSWRK